MPTYTLKCNKCSIETIKRFGITDDTQKSCDSVNQTGCDGQLQKVVTAPQFALKGSGWYRDGYFKGK